MAVDEEASAYIRAVEEIYKKIPEFVEQIRRQKAVIVGPVREVKRAALAAMPQPPF